MVHITALGAFRPAPPGCPRATRQLWRSGLGRSRFSALWRGPRAPAQNRSLGRLPVVAPLLPEGGGLGIGREMRSGAPGRTPVRVA